jgi:hypothetical protein
MHYTNRRGIDHNLENPWGDDDVRDGITYRIHFAAPGTQLDFRPGTTELAFNRVTQVTWGQVIAALGEEDVIQDDGNGVYWKKAVALGNITGRNHCGLHNLADGIHEKTTEALKGDVRAYMNLCILTKMRELHLCHESPDFTHLIDPVLEAFFRHTVNPAILSLRELKRQVFNILESKEDIDTFANTRVRAISVIYRELFEAYDRFNSQ